MFQHPRGENDGHEERPAALVDDSQPAGHTAVGQFHLIGGIDLPGLVGPLGASPEPIASPAGRRGIEPDLGEAALEGPHAG